jgi:hypothetical protein
MLLSEPAEVKEGGGGGYQMNIVYDSEKKHLVPYPDGEVIRYICSLLYSYPSSMTVSIMGWGDWGWYNGSAFFQ